MMRRDQDRMQEDLDDEYEDSSAEDSEEEEWDDSSEEGFVGARYAAVDQIMRGEAAGSSTDGVGRLARSVTWPAGQVFGRSALRRSSEPYQRKSVSFAEELVETKEYGAYDRSPNSSDSSPLSPYRSLAVEMDPEALAHAEGAAFSLSRIPIAPTEIESRQEMLDETDAPTWGEEFERVEPIQESKNQRLADVAGMAETGTDVSREGGQAKPKVVHTVVALGPGPLNQEAATSSASSYSGHAFSSGLPGKAVTEMTPLTEVSQASDASEEATGSDGVGSEVDDQSDSLDGDVALPECAPADASVLNVREAKQDGKGERDEKEEKEEGEQLAASLAGALVASDAEQSKAEPDGSGSDGEDALETLGQAPPESESHVGTSGQHSDSDVQIADSPAVQHPTLLEVVNTSSKEKMAAKMQEKQEMQEKREPEGLLAQGLLQALLATFCCCGTRQREA